MAGPVSAAPTPELLAAVHRRVVPGRRRTRRAGDRPAPARRQPRRRRQGAPRARPAAPADDGGAQAHDLRAHLPQLDLEALPVGLLEGAHQVLALEIRLRDADGEDMRLPGELHVGLVLHGHRLDLDAFGREQPAPLVHLRRQDAARLAEVQAEHGLVDGLDEVVPHVGDEAARAPR